jgi:hypothetical protein
VPSKILGKNKNIFRNNESLKMTSNTHFSQEATVGYISPKLKINYHRRRGIQETE